MAVVGVGLVYANWGYDREDEVLHTDVTEEEKC